jgi:hypothetical protein
LENFTLPDVDDARTPLGAAMRECEEYCVPDCCGMGAYNVTVEHLQRWADGAFTSDLERARRDVDMALELLVDAPEQFYFLDANHSRS